MKKKHQAETTTEEIAEETMEEIAEETSEIPEEEREEAETQDAPEEAIGDTEEAAPEDGTAEMEEALERARAEAEEYKRKWYSVTAEYENYRRRTATQSAQRYVEGRSDVVCKLFPIADNLDRALAACGDEGTKKGIQMVVTAFEKLLADEKITVIDPVGQPFDAEKHEAIMAVDPEEGEESGTVKQVYLKGYEREGKVLRFAQVVVVR